MTIGIIGFGRFGSLAASVLKKYSDVVVYHYRNDKEIVRKAKAIGVKLVDFETASRADVVVLAVPIVETEKVIGEVAKYAKNGALIVDTCSVKVEPCRWLKKYIKDKNIEIMGTHPMFGPVTTRFDLDKQSWSLENLQIVLCPIRIGRQRLDAIRKFLDSLGLKVIETSPDNHDRQNAKTLSLVHFIGRVLNKAGVGPQEIFTPGYTDLLKIMPHTNSDDWQLFYDMNNYNHYADKIRKNFLNAGKFIEEKIIRSRQK